MACDHVYIEHMEEERYAIAPVQAINFTTPPASLIFALINPSAIHIILKEKNWTYSARADTKRAFTMKGRLGKLTK
jgi:hypothetical protein